MMTAFLKVTADANAMWADSANRMDEAATAETMATFGFPTVADQLGAKWLGGGAQAFMKGVADVFVEADSIDSALETYENTVNIESLTALN